ncbi:hypothetical protein NK8_71980 (plasmid) [Caballeronia sp. NK8]|uniref:hypothetical protein n=1 Tax=Caballeronia sp. NK8 TaxID=140098 RepID=UPI001BB6F456|nr:hypothetical protein [Caballeronia sp. NK8]BCQ29008.1 hypothetical protein NK8_71980 [Caballeronia sp. NK8]
MANRCSPGKTVGLPVAGHVRDRDYQFSIRGPVDRAAALAEAIQRLGPLADALFNEQGEEQLKLLLRAVTPVVPVPEHTLREAAMRKAGMKRVLEASDWLTAAQIAQLAELSGSNPSQQPNRWKHDGMVFAVDINGKDHFPAYGLDPDRKYRPRRAMTDVLKAFGNSKDGWALAFWFASVNSYLGGARPLDVLQSDPKRVIEAAEAEVEGVVHG